MIHPDDEIQSCAEAIYELADELNEALEDAARLRLHVPLTIQEMMDDTGYQFHLLGSPVYLKVTPRPR